MAIDDPSRQQRDSKVEEEFLQYWKNGDPPDLSTFVAEHQITDSSELAYLIQLDQRERVLRGCSRPLEDYFADYPILAEDEEASLDVIFQEFVLGEESDPELADQLAGRFPQFSDLLHRQISVYRLLSSDEKMVDLPDQGMSPENTALVDLPSGVEERFDVQELIGRGGAGAVYRAVDRSLGRTVALKVLHHNRSAARSEFQRFLSEAEIIARLTHPNIVQLFEVLRSGDQFALVLEYVDGGTLEERLSKSPLSPRESARLVQTLALAVSYAHGKGIIHRDLKPGNVLLTRANQMAGPQLQDGLAFTPKLADFGLAKPFTDTPGEGGSRQQTITGEILGTPKYLSPEQVRGASAEFLPAIDTHAIGVILFETLTGGTPFVGPTIVDYLHQVVDQEVRFSLSDQRKIPRDLQIISLKSLEKDPAKRYASAHELADDLGRYLEGLPILARPISSLESIHRWVRRYPAVAGLVSAVMLLSTLLAIGSTISAFWLRQQTKIAIEAERKATVLEQSRRDELFHSLVENARSLSESGREGQRLGAIQRLREAMSIVPFDSATQEVQREIYNIALAASAHSDVRELTSIPIGKRRFFDQEAFDRDLKTLICAEPADDTPSLRTLDDSASSWPLMSEKDPYDARRRYRLSDSGRWIADYDWTGSVHRLRLWDVRSRRVVWTSSSAIYLTSSFHPDDRHLAYSQDGSIHVLDMEQLQTVTTSPNRYVVRSLRYSPDGSRIAVGGIDGDLQIVDQSSWSSTNIACPDPIGEFAWHPRKPVILAATTEGRLYAWDIPNRKGAFLTYPRTPVTALRYSPNGAYLAIGDQVSTRLCRSDGLGGVLELRGRLIGFDGNSTRIAVAGDDRIRIGELIDPPGMRQIRVGAESTTFHPDSSVLAISGGDGVKIYSTDGLSEIADLQLDRTGPVAFAPDGRSMSTFGTFSGPLIWTVRNEPTRTIGPPSKLSLSPTVGESPIGLRPQHGGKQIAYSPDGQRLAVVNYRNSRVELHYLSNRSSRVLGSLPNVVRVAISPNGLFIAGASLVKPRVVVWNTTTNQAVLDLPGHGEASFNSDGTRLATRSIASIDVFSCDSWQRISTIPIHVNLDTSNRPIAFQPRTHLVAVAGASGKVCLVDSTGGTIKAELPIPPGHKSISHLCFSPDGRYLSATRMDFDVVVWDLAALEKCFEEFGILDDLTPQTEYPSTYSDLSIAVDRGRLPFPGEWHKFWRMLAIQESIEHRWTDALDSVDKAIADCRPDEIKSLADLQTLRGNLLWRCNRGEEACNAWKNAMDLSPDSLAAVRSLAIIYAAGPVNLRDPARAMSLTSILESHDRYRQDAQILKGMAQVRQGEAQKGRESLEKASGREAWEPAISYSRAMAYILEGDPSNGRHLFEAIAARPLVGVKADELGIVDLAAFKKEVEQRLQMLNGSFIIP